MMNITFSNGIVSKSIILDKAKYIFVNRTEEYWLLMQSLKATANSISVSEYSEELNEKYYIMLDGELPCKTDEIFFVNQHFNLDEDLKLGTKSLSYRYLNNGMENNSFSEEALQLNSMLNVYAEAISDDLITFESADISIKNITKFLVANMIVDEYRINSLNLSYEDLIITQLKLIEGGDSPSKRSFVVIDIPILTQKIKNYIDKSNSGYFIILFFKGNNIDLFENLYTDGIDFENDELLYERMINMSNKYDVNEYKNELLIEHFTNLNR